MSLDVEFHLERLLKVVEKVIEDDDSLAEDNLFIAVESVEITSINNGSGTFEVTYESGLSPPASALSGINDVLVNWNANKSRFDQIDETNAFYDNAVSSGYIVSTGTLSTSDLDGKNFPLDHESLSYLTMQLLSAETTNATTIEVEASDGTLASLSLSDLRNLLVSYADSAQTIRKNRITEIKNINEVFNGYDGGGGYTEAVP